MTRKRTVRVEPLGITSRRTPPSRSCRWRCVRACAWSTTAAPMASAAAARPASAPARSPSSTPRACPLGERAGPGPRPALPHPRAKRPGHRALGGRAPGRPGLRRAAGPAAEALLGPLVATADLLSDGLLVLDAQGRARVV
ncbi:MAG: hypothetical protein M5R38_12125 [Candidatus Methylomirabilis sp.]|nr:hypothetical protein [Candidatus Methylomirabilis sp.]